MFQINTVYRLLSKKEDSFRKYPVEYNNTPLSVPWPHRWSPLRFGLHCRNLSKNTYCVPSCTALFIITYRFPLIVYIHLTTGWNYETECMKCFFVKNIELLKKNIKTMKKPFVIWFQHTWRFLHMPFTLGHTWKKPGDPVIRWSGDPITDRNPIFEAVTGKTA